MKRRSSLVLANPPRVGLIGCGRIAHIHMHFLRKLGIPVAAVADLSETRAKLFKEKYGLKAHYTKIDRLITEEQLDVVHILTDPQSHFSLVLQALELGCHVLVEKPFCSTLEEADTIYSKARERNRIVCVDYTRAYDPMVLKARQILETGRYGKIARLEYDCGDPYWENREKRPKWLGELKAGVLSDLLPHAVSLLFTFDACLEVRNVRVRTAEPIGIKEILADLSSAETGALIKLSVKIRPVRNELNIYCENGTIRVNLRNFYSVYLRERGLPNVLERGANTVSEGIQILLSFAAGAFGFLTGKSHPYAGLYTILRKFYSGISKKTQIDPLLVNGRAVVALTQEIMSEVMKQNKSEDRFRQKYFERMDKKANILITGGTGFIGTALTKALSAEGSKVRVFCRRSSRVDDLPMNIGLWFGDIRDISALRGALDGIDMVYHCAAAMSGDWADFYESTVLGTKNLLEASRGSNVKRIIYLSSLSVLNYSLLRSGSCVTENAPLEDKPEKRGLYSRSKILAEEEVRKFAGENPKVKVIVVRPGSVYGKDLNRVLKNAGVRVGRFLFTCGSERSLDLVYIENLVDALVKLGEKECPNSVYHIVDIERPTVSQFLEIYNSLVEDKITTVHIPLPLWKLAFWIEDLIMTALGRSENSSLYRFSSISKSFYYQTDQTQKDLGWEPRYGFTQAMGLSLNK